jgi:TolB-like protein
MKRCPQCNRVETDDALVYCRVDGAALISDSAAAASEIETSILPHTTDARADRSTAPTTALPTPPPAATSQLTKSKLPIILIAVGAVMGLVVIAVLVIAAGNYLHLSRRTTPAVQSIAVMPFVNASGSPDVEYLSDGMTETLISSLSQLPNLNVKARSSVFRYKGKEQDVQAVGKELNVQAILTGRVVQRGQDLSLYVELVDVASDKVIWSETYNRPMTNLIALQKDIAHDVSKTLQTKLSVAEEQRLAKNYTSNSEAYQLYLLGRFHWNKRSKADFYRAIDYYSQAVRVDPKYAIAYSGLADAYAILQGYDKSVSPRESQMKAREYALKALSLDDTLSEAHASNGVILQSIDFDFAGAEREFKRAIELDPKNTVAYLYYSLLLTGLGRFDEAETNMRRALELEPLSQNLNRNYGNLLMLARRYDESEKQLRKAIELDPNFQTSYFSLANTLHVQGRYAESVEVYAKARDVAGRPEEAAAMRASFKKGGWRGFVLDFHKSNWMSDLRPKYQDAARLVSIGENQRALDALEEAFAERESFLTILKIDPRFDPLRSEPRFQELLKKIGFPS